jgi:ribosomal protein S18 acetylase RimI-like enzyme
MSVLIDGQYRLSLLGRSTAQGLRLDVGDARRADVRARGNERDVSARGYGAVVTLAASADWLITSGEQDPGAVQRLLGLLPGWFGIEASNAAYVEAARRLPTYRAWPADRPGQGEPAGVLLACRHFPQSAEIYWLAVDPALHRRGAGRALVRGLEADLAGDGVEYLQVKTLGPSHPDAGYELTRRFYLGLGFRPLEELHGLWDEHNPCLIMVKALPA